MTDEEIREIRTKALKDDLASINNRLHHAFNQGFELGRKSTTPKEEIIHCKDCKYRDYWGDCNKWSKELDAHKSYILDENMFCGFAEIKDGE